MSRSSARWPWATRRSSTATAAVVGDPPDRLPAAPRRGARRRAAAARGRRRLAGERRHASRSTSSARACCTTCCGRSPSANLMVEVPDFMASDPANVESLHAPARAPATRCCSRAGRTQELPREVLPCFKYSIIDLADERRIGEARSRRPASPASIAHVQSGVRTMADMEASFAARRRTPCSAGRSTTRSTQPRRAPASRRRSPTCRSIVELIRRVDNEEPIDKLESTLQARPVARLQAAALHQLAGVRPARRDQLVPPRDHDARLPAPEALAGAAARHRQQGRQPEAGDVRRGPPRPADGRAGRRQRRRGDAQRDVHLRRVLAARPDVPASRSPSCSARSRCPSASTRRWSKNAGPYQPYLGDGPGGRERVGVRLSARRPSS